MTTISQTVNVRDIKREVRGIQKAARRIAASKVLSRRLLLSTGMYTKAGLIKPQFR